MTTKNKFKQGFVKFKDLYEYVKSYVAKYLELQYKGAWNASTNTPTIADGIGNNGDFYKVSVAGTQNLGSGSIDFTLGDEVRYNESLGVWQKFDTGVTYTAPSNLQREEVSGIKNSSNTVFTISHTPIANSLNLYLNGQLLREGLSDDYTISGSTITLAAAPSSGESIFATYLS